MGLEDRLRLVLRAHLVDHSLRAHLVDPTLHFLHILHDLPIRYLGLQHETIRCPERLEGQQKQ